MGACFHNQLETTKFLMKAGVDLYAMDLAGWNPLVHAAANNHEEVVDWLIVYALRPKTFPAPDPDGFVKNDPGATIFGIPAVPLAVAVAGSAALLVVVPALCVFRRFSKLKKQYTCTAEDDELHTFIQELFTQMDEEREQQDQVTQAWDSVPAHTLQDLHRVKSMRGE